MKSVPETLHRIPWWALLLGGLAVFVALAVFVTPYHILQYREENAGTAEGRAIKREVDNAFAENAINVGRGVLRGLIARTSDPARRAELEEALAGLEEARSELRDAGAEVLRAKREALDSVREAARNTRDAVRNARREAEAALKRVDPADPVARKDLEEKLAAARAAEVEANRALAEGRKTFKRIEIGPQGKDGKPMIEIQIDSDTPAAPMPPVPPAGVPVPMPPVPPAGVPVPMPRAPPAASRVTPVPAPPAVPAPPGLSPETATRIRRNVTGDMYRIGIGAGLILILLPLFVLAVVTKFFADRSRASQRLAEAKRKEAEYHRMSQQVTEAKLSALQAQVEPHFLYNTLASVQALTEVDPARANAMTGHLIQYLRNALPKMRESVSTVGQEVELVRAYLSILQMRMGTRLAFAIDVPEELAALPFPPLMLPSLVENAIKHGLEPQREGGNVHITASLDGARLRMVVSDTGRGFGDVVGAGVGLANIRERLAALYGDAARLTLEGNEPRGVVATIEVPAVGTRSGAGASAAAGPAAARATASAAVEPPPLPGAAAAASPASSAAAASGASTPPASGFWEKAWNGVIVFERVWRKVVYYAYLGLLAIGALAAIGAAVGVAVGAIPVEHEFLTGPLGGLVAFAGAVIAFIAFAAALGLVALLLYGLGFFLAALAIFVAATVLLGLSPVFAPIVLLGLLVWWVVKRNRATAAAASAPVPPAPVPPAPVPPAQAGS